MAHRLEPPCAGQLGEGPCGGPCLPCIQQASGSVAAACWSKGRGCCCAQQAVLRMSHGPCANIAYRSWARCCARQAVLRMAQAAQAVL